MSEGLEKGKRFKEVSRFILAMNGPRCRSISIEAENVPTEQGKRF
jgi:hypothetical protein